MSGRPPKRIPAVPTAETLHNIAAFRGLEFTDEQLATAAGAYATVWSKLARLRAVKLQYVPPTITPAHARSWIENGGEL